MSGPVPFGLKPSGALWIDGLMPSGASSASRFATCFVYSRRSGVAQSGS